MTTTIDITETVTDPFANIGPDFADLLAAQFAADKGTFEATKAKPVAEAPTATCKGCGRTLRAAKSRLQGRGPVCQKRYEAAVQTESVGYTAAQVEKATEALEDDAVIRVGHLYLAVSSDGSTRYEVAATGECSCTAAMYGRRCWHTLAARIAAVAGLVATDPDDVPFAPLAGAEDGVATSTDTPDL